MFNRDAENSSAKPLYSKYVKYAIGKIYISA